MKCNYISENVADLFDENSDTARKNEILEHLENCVDCRQSYQEMNQVLSALQPKISIEADGSLKDRVIRQIENAENQNPVNHSRRTPVFTPARKKMIAIAAVLVILFALVPVFNHSGWLNSDARAGNALINKSLKAMEGIRSVYMNFDVRTAVGENFDFIDIKAGFISHKLWKTFTDPPRWRVEKPGRVVVMDGKDQYLYMANPGIAMVGPSDAGFLGWMKIFLDPMKILSVERDLSEKNKAEYHIDGNENTFVLTVKAKAKGDFSNSYMLNSSISESDTRRVYTFDKQSKRLLSVEIFIKSGNSEVQVIKVNDIRYDTEIPESTFKVNLPAGLTWTKASEVYAPGITRVSASTSKEAAKMLFEACQKEDWTAVGKLWPLVLQSLHSSEIKKMLGGLTIISIGEPFKSGDYPGEFVPYSIRFKSGETKKFNLALRKDSNGKWYVDGGL